MRKFIKIVEYKNKDIYFMKETFLPLDIKNCFKEKDFESVELYDLVSHIFVLLNVEYVDKNLIFNTFKTVYIDGFDAMKNFHLNIIVNGI